MKVRFMEEFNEKVPPSTNFSVGYFVGRTYGTKHWICTEEDLKMMLCCGVMVVAKILKHLHSSKDEPPKIPLITGVTPKRKSKVDEDRRFL